MKKLNQKGFTGFEIALLILVLAALGFAGYTVWQKNKPDGQPQTSQSNKATKKTDATKKDELPEGFSKHSIGSTGVSLVYPTNWGEVTEAPQSKGGGYDLYGMNLRIQSDSEAKISRSFNVSSYCAYDTNNKTWTKAGEYPPQSCEPEVLEVSGVKAAGFKMGALGAYGFTYGVDLKGANFLLINDSVLIDGSPEQPPETHPTAEQTEKLKSELDKNVEIILINNKALFE